MRAETRLGELQGHVAAREDDLKRATAAAEEWQRKAASAYDSELPRLHEELMAARSRLANLEHELEMAREQLHQAQASAADFKAKWEDAQSIAIQASSEASDRLAHISQLQQSRADLAKRLASSEELAQTLTRRVEELRAQTEHADKVKAAVEEGFNRQLKQLHAQNTELKLQMASNSSGANEASARMERLNAALDSLRAEKDALHARLQSKEHSLGALQQELDTLRLDRKRTETDLALREEQLRKAELDLARLRKDDSMARKHADGASALQAKIESLTAMNNFLREQVDQKDRHLRDLEERLRRQSDEMRATMSEMEEKNRKLKKREALIAQALKRLESINSLQLVGEGSGTLGTSLSTSQSYGGTTAHTSSYQATSSLGYNPLTAPSEELTPIRPSKLPFTMPASSSQHRSTSNKENAYANYEF